MKFRCVHSQWKPLVVAVAPRNDNAMNQPLLPRPPTVGCIPSWAGDGDWPTRYNFLVYIWLADIRGEGLIKVPRNRCGDSWYLPSNKHTHNWQTLEPLEDQRKPSKCQFWIKNWIHGGGNQVSISWTSSKTRLRPRCNELISSLLMVLYVCDV